MSIRQLTVFVENRRGCLARVTDLLATNHIDLRALSIADTKDFGILRLIVNDAEKALSVLRENGILVQITEVICVKLSDRPGATAAQARASTSAWPSTRATTSAP